MTRTETILLVEREGLVILRNAKDTERFVKYLDKSKRKCDECWIWSGYIKPAYKASRVMPYGIFGVNSTHTGAHRVSWEYANGTEIPQGLFVLHTCDIHSCINPAHLYVGNANDNNKDKTGKGYIKKRKIDEAIRRYEIGDKIVDICNAIGIGHSTLWRHAKRRGIKMRRTRRKSNK